jgi:hypothetical protein
MRLPCLASTHRPEAAPPIVLALEPRRPRRALSLRKQETRGLCSELDLGVRLQA